MKHSVIDTHAHLDMQQFEKDRDDTIKRAINGGVNKIINVGIDIESSKSSIEMARKYDVIHAVAGIHPHELPEFTEENFNYIKELILDDEVVGVGETGLDYFKEYCPRNVQTQWFRKHIEFAKEFKKPLVIHCRDAKEDCLRILKEEKSGEYYGVFHCFSGDSDMAAECIDLGFYISFTGVITYPGAKDLRLAVKDVPLEKILIETDSPFLSPQAKRGKRNEPLYVKYVADKISEIKKVSIDDLLSQVNRNVKQLFKI